MSSTPVTPVMIRKYQITDYDYVIELYKQAGLFDPETDSDIRLQEKVTRDPESILIAESEGLVKGSVSIIEDGRIALLFRLVTDASLHRIAIKTQLILVAEDTLRKKGYREVHIIAPEEDSTTHQTYEKHGFTKGNLYRWFWMKLSSQSSPIS